MLFWGFRVNHRRKRTTNYGVAYVQSTDVPVRMT